MFREVQFNMFTQTSVQKTTQRNKKSKQINHQQKRKQTKQNKTKQSKKQQINPLPHPTQNKNPPNLCKTFIAISLKYFNNKMEMG